MSMIIRIEVPVDDRWHTVHLCGDILHVATRGIGKVELWSLYTDIDDERPRELRVFGTGHPIEDDVLHVGTAIDPGGLVWHLMEQQ